MGRQATFIRLKNKRKFGKLLKIMRALGKPFFDKKWIYPVWTVTLKKSICVGNRKFMPGEKFVAIQGQRYNQLSPERMFGEYAPKDLEIYALEAFPKQTYNKKDKIVKITKWKWE